MAWVKLDDAFYEHPKFLNLPPRSLALWVTGLAWCARNLTDGRLPGVMVPRLGFKSSDVHHLLVAGLWDVDDPDYVFHDYHDFQPSGADVRAHRRDVSTSRSEVGKAGAAIRWQTDSKPIAKRMANAKQTDGPEPEPEPTNTSNKGFTLGAVDNSEPVDKPPLDEIRNIVSIARSEAS